MNVLAVDPDTHATGWAIGNHRGPTRCGVVKAPTNEPPWLRCHLMAKSIKQMLVDEWITASVVEMPGRQGPPGQRGQAVYGLAPGIFFETLYGYTGEYCYGVPVHEWTRGIGKQQRAEMCRAAYPVYAEQADEDKGLHIADAVGLLVWWCQERRARTGAA